ncbi:MAG: hypothetical protein ACW99U_21645 [Candidatus Thorarchaeota archaeon]|jgi:hypothetical protein
MAHFTNSLGKWWMPDEKPAAFLEGYKALYAMDEGVYLDNPYEKETQANDDWYSGFFTAMRNHSY